MHYASPKHERLYRSITRGRDYQSRTLAALDPLRRAWEKCSTGAFLTHLLTFDYRLWYYWRPVFAETEQQPIDWKNDRYSGSEWDALHLEQAARDIACHSSKKLQLFDLADRGSIPLKVLRLIVTALAIARCDPKEARDEIIRKRRRAA